MRRSEHFEDRSDENCESVEHCIEFMRQAQPPTAGGERKHPRFETQRTWTPQLHRGRARRPAQCKARGAGQTRVFGPIGSFKFRYNNSEIMMYLRCTPCLNVVFEWNSNKKSNVLKYRKKLFWTPKNHPKSKKLLPYRTLSNKNEN